MNKTYQDRQKESLRKRRPNCRVPVDPRIAETVAEVRGAIAETLVSVELEPFPVVRMAELVVRKNFSRLAPGLRSVVLAEVVEAVLADPVARLALRQAEMHVA